jgi:outer membrane protein TolC
MPILDAEAELFRAEAASINAQLSSIEALINYELATGKQIYQF